MRRIIAVWLIMIMMISGIVGIVNLSTDADNGNGDAGIRSASQPKSGLTAHDPIYIHNNSDFASQASSEGWTGDGSEGNPYIIENYDIDASTTHGIQIKNTNVYFIIRNCVIHDGSNIYDGIYFYKVQNCKIDNATSYNNYCGIWLDSSSNNSINACTVYLNNGYAGIVLRGSSNNIISACIAYGDNYYGIRVEYSSNNNIISTCTVYNNDYGGIRFDDSSDNIISACTFYYTYLGNNAYGIDIRSSSNNSISACTVYNNTYEGICLTFSNDNSITNCIIHDNSWDGIYIGSSSRNSITSNQIYSNYQGVSLSYSSSNNEIHYNNIYNNTKYGVKNYENAPIYVANATYNWWGSASGPYHPSTNPSGTGNKVSDNVIYNPWLTEPWTGEIPNQPPTAFMDPILPNPATQGQTVTFTGRGYDSDGYIIAYNWRSSIDGQLSTSASFSTSTLSVGTHTVYFKVQDNNWTWSSEVSGVLVINPPIQPTLTITVNANPITVNSSGASTITITVTNGTTPISGATINLVSNNSGSFSSLTDNGNGTYTAIFTAPSVTTQIVCRIIANATKTGYTNNSDYIDVTVNPVAVNHAPIVNSITANPTSVTAGGTVAITVDATDEDPDDVLTYVYSYTGGTIAGSGSTVTWTAPGTTGDYTITVYVNDGTANSNSKSVTITVEKPKKEAEKGFIPGFDVWLSLIAVIGVCVILLKRK